jgi:hypothetical protein
MRKRVGDHVRVEMADAPGLDLVNLHVRSREAAAVFVAGEITGDDADAETIGKAIERGREKRCLSGAGRAEDVDDGETVPPKKRAILLRVLAIVVHEVHGEGDLFFMRMRKPMGVSVSVIVRMRRPVFVSFRMTG